MCVRVRHSATRYSQKQGGSLARVSRAIPPPDGSRPRAGLAAPWLSPSRLPSPPLRGMNPYRIHASGNVITTHRNLPATFNTNLAVGLRGRTLRRRGNRLQNGQRAGYLWCVVSVSQQTRGRSGDNEGMKHGDRRRGPQPALSPAEILERMPALVVPGRIPVPTLAIAGDGSILVANPAAAEMLGYPEETLLSMKFHEIFRTPIAGSAITALRAHAGQLVELAHADGSTVRAKMSGSALLRGDDPAALAAFQDLTEELWAEEV